MPIKNAAKKALKQSTKRREQNRQMKEKMAAVIKKFKKAITGKKIDDAKKLIPVVAQIVDKSAKKNVIKSNKASRIKSRLSQSLNKIAGKTK